MKPVTPISGGVVIALGFLFWFASGPLPESLEWIAHLAATAVLGGAVYRLAQIWLGNGRMVLRNYVGGTFAFIGLLVGCTVFAFSYLHFIVQEEFQPQLLHASIGAVFLVGILLTLAAAIPDRRIMSVRRRA